MGLEGVVSRPGLTEPVRSPHWVKVKNRKHVALARVMDQF